MGWNGATCRAKKSLSRYWEVEICAGDIRQKSLWGLCFVSAMFGDVSLTIKVFSLLRDTKSSSPVRSTLSDSWILPPLAIPTSVEAKNTQTRSSKSLVFPVIDVSGLEYAAGAKFINVPSALQSISARAGAWPDSPNRQPSARPSIQSIFFQRKKENCCCSRHKSAWLQPDIVSGLAPAHRKTLININRSRNKTAT